MPDDGTTAEPAGLDVQPDSTGGESPGDSDVPASALSLDDALKTISALRDENAKRRIELRKMREQAEETQRLLDEVKSDREELQQFRDAAKTEEERRTELLASLEEKAAQADVLRPYLNFVKHRYESAVEGISALDDDDPRKASYTELLSTFGKDEYLKRLKALEALRAAEGMRHEETEMVREGDQSSPTKKGAGVTETPFARKIAWSPAGMREAELAGMVPPRKD